MQHLRNEVTKTGVEKIQESDGRAVTAATVAAAAATVAGAHWAC